MAVSVAAPTHLQLVDFVYAEARLLDERRYDEWYALFADDGYYWVPLVPGQTDPINHTSLAYEDKLLLRLRVERLKSPGPFSQRPESRSHHLLQRPEVERADAARNEYVTRTQFHYTETRGDEQLIYVGAVFHHLALADGVLKIRLKRIDILNCDAALPSIQLFL
jgi:3-phenylpropionate/cinnamic acid dioxygenase small subunit